MANDCIGIMRVASKDKETIERLKRIMNYNDEEFFISRCRQCDEQGEAEEEDGLWVQEFIVDGCWCCERFFTEKEDKTMLLCTGYEKDKNGRDDYDKPIYGTAHITNLVELAKLLDFGCEIYSKEPMMCFCEHLAVDHLGNYKGESGDYEEVFPKLPNGEYDFSNGEEKSGIKNFEEFKSAKETYENT